MRQGQCVEHKRLAAAGRRRWVAPFGAVILVSLWGASFGAHAQDREVSVERFRPALDGFGFIGIDGSTMPGSGRWNLGLWTTYSRNTAHVSVGGPRQSIVRHRLVGDLQFQIGIGSRAAFGLDLPVLLHQQGDAVALGDGGGSLSGSGIGDPRFHGRVRILGEAADPDAERSDGPGVAIMLSLPVPVGSQSRLMSDRPVTFDLQTVADFHILGAGAGLMLGWRFRPEERAVGLAQLQNELLYGFGLKLPIPPVSYLFGIVELRGATSFRGKRSNALEGDIGLSYAFSGFLLRAAVGTGFVRGVGVPNIRATVGLTYSPKSQDMDHDGIPDSRDECPRLPEDIDGFQDEDGCTDPDNDNDFIPDADDRCPNEEALEGRDKDEDGCTDPE